jgi:hypothetical protein
MYVPPVVLEDTTSLLDRSSQLQAYICQLQYTTTPAFMLVFGVSRFSLFSRKVKKYTWLCVRIIEILWLPYYTVYYPCVFCAHSDPFVPADCEYRVPSRELLRDRVRTVYRSWPASPPAAALCGAPLPLV